MPLPQHSREPALAAAHIQHAPAREIAEVFQNQPDMINARIDGRREVLLIGRCLVKCRTISESGAAGLRKNRIPAIRPA